MTRRVRVPIANTPQKTVTIDPAATEGAVIGRNVWNPDGSLFEPGTVATPAGDYPVTIWRRVMEVPANVKALASQTGAGLYAITEAGSSATRTIEPTAGETTVANGSGVAGNPKVGLADLPDTGGAALLKITRDGKGRVSGTSAATTDDLPEGAGNLYHTAARVRAAVLTGLSTATNAVITAADSVLSALGKLQAQITAHVGRTDNPHSVTAAQVGAVASIVAGTNVTVDATDPQNPIVSSTGGGSASLPPGYIDGLRMVWVSGTALTVTSGSAYIEGSGAVLESPADIAKAGLSLTASTWYHVYLFDNAGTPDVEIVTAAPAAPYNGSARSKEDDPMRRYIGSVRASSSGDIYRFRQIGDAVKWLEDLASGAGEFRVLSNGKATASETVSCASVVPPTALAALVRMANTDASARWYFNATGVAVIYGQNGVSAGQVQVADLALGDLHFDYYWNAPPVGGAYVDVMGYTLSR